MSILFFVGLSITLIMIVKDTNAWKRIIDGIKTRKEDLEVNWKTLEKYENH